MARWISLAAIAVALTAAGTFVVLSEPAPEPRSIGAVTRPRSNANAISRPNPSPAPPPKLQILGDTVYHFGTMPKRTAGSHSWDVKNVGEGPLQVWLESSTCSCTVAKLQRDPAKGQETRTVTVMPGQTAPIEVSWNTKEWKDFVHAATLGTNDPDSPSFTLTVRGKVLPSVTVLPSDRITFSNISNEGTQRATLTVVSPDKSDLKLTKLVTSKPEWIVVRSTPLTPAEAKEHKVKSGYTLTVEIPPGIPPGEFREELIIQTDHPKEPEARVTLAGRVLGAISALPERFRLPSVRSRSGASGEILLLVRGGRETQFTVAQKPEKVQVDIQPDRSPQAKGRYRMTITVPPGTAAGPVNDPILLKTDHPEVPVIRIPVNIFVSRSG